MFGRLNLNIQDPRFCLSSLFSQGSMFLDLLLHARSVLNARLVISYDQWKTQYSTAVLFTTYSSNNSSKTKHGRGLSQVAEPRPKPKHQAYARNILEKAIIKSKGLGHACLFCVRVSVRRHDMCSMSGPTLDESEQSPSPSLDAVELLLSLCNGARV